MSIPQSSKALVLERAVREAQQKNSEVYHDVVLVQKPINPLQPNELLIRVSAAAFNRRDVRFRPIHFATNWA
jgi:NADPH:quinone reductase-like Zn-dependent oxidoreductase